MLYWKTRTFVKIYYSYDKQIEQVNSYFNCQTSYDSLWLYLFLLQIRSILLQFMTFSDFMTVCVTFAFIKEKHFRRTHIQLLFSRSFLGVFHFCRSQIAFQRFPRVVANIPLTPKIRWGGSYFQNSDKKLLKKLLRYRGVNWKERFQIVSSVILQKSMFSLLLEYFVFVW